MATRIENYGTITLLASGAGDHIWFASDVDAHQNRRMYIDNGHAVSLIAGEGAGFGFDVYNLGYGFEAGAL